MFGFTLTIAFCQSINHFITNTVDTKRYANGPNSTAEKGKSNIASRDKKSNNNKKKTYDHSLMHTYDVVDDDDFLCYSVIPP